jgi:phosphatidylethanolamine/phosphatidyl-N-methylethanolamine N-methyltransferase
VDEDKVKLLRTDIGLDYYDVHKIVENQYKLIQDTNVMMKGMYRKIVAIKKGNTR